MSEDEDMIARTAFLAGIASDRAPPEARAAFERLLALWHPRLLRFARSRVPDLAEDVVQDAVITMARNIHRLRDPATFGSWALTIVQRRSVDAVRKAVRRRTAEGEAERPADNAPDADRALDLRAALAALPETERTLVRLHYTEGRTVAELASQLGVPPGTVKSRLHAVRVKLKTRLKGDDHE
jgi:RNA polymerase sigma-70 factor (ECF subfamily)